MKLYSIFLYSLVLFGCGPLYYGISLNRPDLNTTPEQNLGKIIKPWEDSSRIEGKTGEFEWWYIDAVGEDGTIVVVYFYRVHVMGGKHFIGMSITPPGEESFFDIQYFKNEDATFSNEKCDVRLGGNWFYGDLNNYSIKVDPFGERKIGVDIAIESKAPPYRPEDGIIRMGEDYFAWLSAVPNGEVSGTVYLNGDSIAFIGEGYHDHNWANAPFQTMMNSWYWARAKVGPYTVIGAQLNLRKDRGGYTIPILMVTTEDSIIVDKYGPDNVLSKFSNPKVLDSKFNESPSKNFTLSSYDNTISVTFKGEKVIDKTNLFDRLKAPLPMKFLFDISGIDPTYTRFYGTTDLTVTQFGDTLTGNGILEFMDLR